MLCREPAGLFLFATEFTGSSEKNRSKDDRFVKSRSHTAITEDTKKKDSLCLAPGAFECFSRE
jgi:hypothetical protein